MSNLERRVKRDTKIMRTLVRLKHSLAADEEIADRLEEQKRLLTNGQIPQLDVDLADLTGDA